MKYYLPYSMKLILIPFLLFLNPLFGSAQFLFEPNAESTVFNTPHDSSNIFEYKFIEQSPWHYSSYLELTLNQDSIWSYKRFIINNLDKKWIELPPIAPPLNIEKLWTELMDLGFLTLKPENKETYMITKNGNLIELPYEKYQMIQPTDMANYVSQFSNELGIRTIMHYEPIYIFDKLHNSKQKWYVPELYKASFCYSLIKGKFKFSDYRNTFYEIYNSEKHENSKDKRKRTKKRH